VSDPHICRYLRGYPAHAASCKSAAQASNSHLCKF
jgi:hypothetical protein